MGMVTMNPNDPRLKRFDKIDDLELASILVVLTKTRIPMWQKSQIVIQLCDRFYENNNGGGYRRKEQ